MARTYHKEFFDREYTAKEAYSRLWGYARKYRFRLVVGVVCGMLIDLGYANGIGVFSIVLTIVCFIVGYAANNLIVAKFTNFLLYSFVAVGGIFMLYFLIHFVWAGVEDRWMYFTNHLLSRMVQTFLWSLAFYPLNRAIYKTLGEES